MFDRGETSDFELEFLSNLGEGLVKSLYAAGYTFNGERKIQLNAKYDEDATEQLVKKAKQTEARKKTCSHFQHPSNFKKNHEFKNVYIGYIRYVYSRYIWSE